MRKDALAELGGGILALAATVTPCFHGMQKAHNEKELAGANIKQVLQSMLVGRRGHMPLQEVGSSS